MKIFVCILGVLVALTGLHCCMQPILTEVALASFLVATIAIAMLVQGVGEIIAWVQERKTGKASTFTLVAGILSVLLGAVMLFCNLFAIGFMGSTFLACMLAIWMVVVGVMRIASSVKYRMDIQANGGSWAISLVLGVLLLLSGIGCLVAPLALISFMGIMFGIGMIISGVSLVCLGASIPKKNR